jgi:hypothetical protein
VSHRALQDVETVVNQSQGQERAEAISGLWSQWDRQRLWEEENDARLVNKGVNGAGGLEIACALRIGDVERDVAEVGETGRKLGS